MSRMSEAFQSELFGDPVARRSDPGTSHQAAERVMPIAGTDRMNVLIAHWHNRMTGLTDFELAHHLNRQQTSVGKRRGELRDAGMIAPTLDKRSAPSGSPALVWKITQKGIEFLTQSGVQK